MPEPTGSPVAAPLQRALAHWRAGGKYSPLMEQPRVMDACTYRSNCVWLLCIICAASLFSGSSGLGACGEGQGQKH